MGFVEDGLYCYTTYHSKNLVDNDSARDSELCYGMLDCQKCYNCVVLKDCSNCHDSYFSFGCKSCENIAFCSNLRNKKNYIFNKQVSKEEYEKKVAELNLGEYKNLNEYLKYCEEFFIKHPRRFMQGTQNENVKGDYIYNRKISPQLAAWVRMGA